MGETSAMDEEDLPFAEPVRELPREVRGILVLVKGKKTKKGTLKVRPNLVIPTEKERRSKEKETSPVTTPEAKKSPKVIKESNMFMDVLSDIMKDTPKKKKRRLSEVKAEREAKEEAAKKMK